ncbi:atrial natriuretic peptide receptor 1-like [Paramacrobiotus metropolitanus]|uniref:atrial natriuretic peptide receptor 1-like n=1 Tax=Paramacrobiotus metropolitanus TaxID=2943436 RepID=UPI002445C3FD|nr:atrial natriuretic peptide receptor 1-like [Paramacrobiotus metropolitanus]
MLEAAANATPACRSGLHVEIFALTIVHPVLLATLPYLGPAYTKALQRIRQSYPEVNITQRLLSDPNYRNCVDLSADGVNKVTAAIADKYRETAPDPCHLYVLLYLVFIFLGEPNGFRKLLLYATELHMTDGEHVFVIMTPFRFNSEPGYLTWKKGDQDDETVRLAYRSVLIIEPDSAIYGDSDLIGSFSLEMKNMSKSVYNYTYKPYELISPHVAATYAALLTFAEIVDRLRITNSVATLSSGKELAKEYLNRTFVTEVGQYYVDPVGERIPTVLVEQLDWNTSEPRTLFLQDPASLSFRLINKPYWPGIWPPRNEPHCGFRGDSIACVSTARNVDLYAGSAGGIAVLVIVLAIAILRKRAYDALLKSSWNVDPSALSDLSGNRTFETTVLENGATAEQVTMNYKNQQTVWITSAVKLWDVAAARSFSPDKTTAMYLNHLLRLDHPNVNSFIGLCILESASCTYFVSDYVQRGSLAALLSRTGLDYDLQIALIFDVLNGAKAIERSPIRSHGNLSSNCCFLDKHFTLKIGETGFTTIKTLITPNNYKVDKNHAEHLHSDLYAVGLILFHIITSDDPFPNPAKVQIKPQDLFPTNFATFLPLIKSCTDDTATAPAVTNVAGLLRKVKSTLELKHGYADNVGLLERILRRLEDYTEELDHQVAVRTIALSDERRKCDLLLREMLPGDVVDLLRKGVIPEPDSFEAATILFTEIGGFKDILEKNKPAAVMMFLNEVYTAFDRTLSRFDVYKVETIKDSYMVVSGVPTRNGHMHGKEICKLATSMLKTYADFEKLFDGTALRAGIHTGSCAAGVVGHKAPRYCLFPKLSIIRFGDTINTASRMLMYSDDSRIHISWNTFALLKEHFAEFKTEMRGLIEVKGKGLVTTYWLVTPRQLETQ